MLVPAVDGLRLCFDGICGATHRSRALSSGTDCCRAVLVRPTGCGYRTCAATTPATVRLIAWASERSAASSGPLMSTTPLVTSTLHPV